MTFSIFYLSILLIILQTTIIFQVLLKLLSESNIDHIIVNPGKFQALIFDKCKGNHTKQIISIDQKKIIAASKV